MSYGTSSLDIGPLLPLEMERCSQDDNPEEISHHGEQLESRPIEQESTFNPWLIVDIVGSPGLTGLIGALTIDLCEEIPSLDLSSESLEESQEVCKFINPYKGCSSTITCKAQKQQSLPKPTPPSVLFSTAAFSTKFSKQSRRRMPGPLDELYPFPSPLQSKRLLKNPRTDHLASSYSLGVKELECRTRFKALKSMDRREIIKLVNEMQSIAWRHHEIEQFGPQKPGGVVWLLPIWRYRDMNLSKSCMRACKLSKARGPKAGTRRLSVFISV